MDMSLVWVLSLVEVMQKQPYAGVMVEQKKKLLLLLKND